MGSGSSSQVVVEAARSESVPSDARCLSVARSPVHLHPSKLAVEPMERETELFQDPRELELDSMTRSALDSRGSPALRRPLETVRDRSLPRRSPRCARLRCRRRYRDTL
ncbi:hypothetical protein NY2A_b653L [Paramecium bursaria Chlorella virus NY2A]|uniref:Uncharacterized protein b653L n=1 Tax=Paramecium bursaria Chlorella virus NY2A TaxID=46021 RepID=A7IXH8_PBCVN|nr:hypothetical protein NY2A_b653L [Paramecium bursaria Chlorella virus NY2A]ABT15052.1 hypothetical protein NY2A_b653L [Paramecium bursaria Chlorella virus NY2A]